MDAKAVQDNGRKMGCGQQDTRHAVASKTRSNEVPVARRNWADKGKGIGRRGHQPSPHSTFASRQRQLSLVGVGWPTDYLVFGPGLHVFGNARQMFVVVAALQPLTRVVGDDRFGTTQGDYIKRCRKLQVIVPDFSVPVLRTGVLDEALGCLYGAYSTNTRQDDIRVFGQKMRSPGILSNQLLLLIWRSGVSWTEGIRGGLGGRGWESP